MNFGQPLESKFSLSEFVMVNWDSLLDGGGGGGGRGYTNVEAVDLSITKWPHGL